jgi:hypothetical protein
VCEQAKPVLLAAFVKLLLSVAALYEYASFVA